MRLSSVWTEARVEALRDLTPTVREITLRPLAGGTDWAPGAHLQVQVLVQGQPQTRSYSLLGDGTGPLWRIAVKRLDEGRGGSLAMWQLAEGDHLSVNGPQNHFPLDLNAPAALLVAGGIGITPLVRMAHALRQRGVPLRFLYGARTVAEQAYAGELQALLGSDLVLQASDTQGALDFAAEIARLPVGGQLYVCGPVPMLQAVQQAWAQAARPAADLRFETFGSSGRLAPQPFRVRVPSHGLDLTVPANLSLMEALRQAGVPTLSDCQRGECGLCAVPVLALEGEIDHRDVFLSEHEKHANQRLCACVSRAVGTVTIDSLYRPDAL